MSEQALPPAWVLKRDGSRVPFDADRISQALFAATETLGRPDAFLARELTDGVLHFLAVEKDDDTLTTAQIAEIVGKTVRELGQPALAEAFAAAPRTAKIAEDIITLHAARDVPPRVLFPKLVREFTQQAIYSRQVLAAQSDSLLDLMGLETPGELSAAIVGAFDSPATALEELRRYVGGCAVFDCPEYGLLQRGSTTAAVDRFASEVKLAARLLDLRTVVNLNSGEPPPWAGDLARGPLFAGQGTTADEKALASVVDALLEGLVLPVSALPLVRVSWHLGERDFQSVPACENRLRRVSHLAAEGAAITFVLDRPRRPLLLAEGVDRQNGAVLLSVLLHLSQLAARPGLREDSELFLQKLGSLARLAVSAGVQKRDYLRRLERIEPSPLTTGFLLERARLVIVPVGLEVVALQITGRELTAGGTALDFAKQIVVRLRDVIKQEGRATHLEGCVHGHYSFAITENADKGPTTGNAALKNQLRAAGSLHSVAERGMLTLALEKEEAVEERVMATLRQTWETSEIAMVGFSLLA